MLNLLRKTESIRSNFDINLESDADSSVNGEDTQDDNNGSNVAATNCRPFVALRRSKISEDLNLENISQMTKFAAVHTVESEEDKNSKHPFRTFGQR